MRRLVLATTLLLAPLAAFGQAASQISTPVAPCADTDARMGYLDLSTVRVWPGDAPGSKGNTCDDTPTLSVVTPQPGQGNGTAVLVFPGGAYIHLASNLEGRQVADWFAAHGVTAFVLRYRLGPRYLMPAPLEDAQRAMQLVRAHAADYHIDPARIGVIGFSAGGHLAALVSNRVVAAKTEADDTVERVSSRPDFTILGYPWIGGITPSTEHLSYCKLVGLLDTPEGRAHCDQLTRDDSPDRLVTHDTPPVFIYHTTDDGTVPVQQALSYYDAAIAAGVSAEMHIFAHGHHGSGLGGSDPSLEQWPNLLAQWMRAQGLFNLSPAAIMRRNAPSK